MNSFILKYSVYIAVLLGILLGYPLLQNMEQRRMAKTFGRCVLFSCVSVSSVLLFASFEKLIAGHGFSVGAVSTYGVYLFAPFILLAVCRKDREKIFDQYAVYVLPSLFLQRIRCLFNGCCGGTGIAQTGMHWPVREAELLFYAVILVILLKRHRRGNTSGELFPLLMMYYGVFRFLEEFFREGTGLFHPAHIWSLISILAGYSIYVEIRKHKK